MSDINEVVDKYLGESLSDLRVMKGNTGKLIKKIAKMTDNNDHSGAAVAGADLLNKVSGGKYNKELEAFQEIQKEHEKTGSMPYELGQKRYEMLQKMWKDANKYLPAGAAKMFKGSY
jgi:hypothetical protein